MSTAVKPIPEGMHTVTPYLIIRDAAKAIEFYKNAFGAQVRSVIPAPDGKIMHAQIQIGDSVIMMSDENPQFGSLGPESRGGATSSLMLYVNDVDTAFDKAVKAGCTIKVPVTNQFWGDRYGHVVDPFGHCWGIATHVQDMSDEEMIKNAKDACKQMAEAQKK